MKHSYPIRILIGLDQFANVILGPVLNLIGFRTFDGPWGYPDETISGILGKHKQAGILSSHPIAKIVSWLLDSVAPGHTVGAVENEDGMTIERLKELG